MCALRWLPEFLPRSDRSSKPIVRRKKARRSAFLSSSLKLSAGPLWLEQRRAMSIEPLEERQLLTAVPDTLYVARSFYDQTTSTNTTAPNVGDTVNWLASGQFAEVDGLTFGTNAFTSIQAAVTAAAVGDTIDVASGTYIENVDITNPVSLVGAAGQTVLQAPSTLGTGITIATTAGTTNIADLTISGFVTGVSVAANSSALLTGDTVTGCLVGSGVSNYGVATLSDSSITNNLGGSAGDGGGILNGGTLTITASTVSGNFANLGGGIYNFGTLTVSDSTIANNSAAAGGGGIENSSGHMLTLENSTVSGNSVKFDTGGGVDNRGPAYVANTIIAGNSLTGTNASDPDVSGVFTATDHNLIGVVGDATGFITTGATASVILGSDIASAVGLGPLADYGGPTQTMALLAGSPAIDNGDASPASPFTVPDVDQRGQLRTFNGTMDVGAYETAPTTLYVANSFYDQTTGTTTSSPNTGDTVNWLASGQFAEVDGLTFGTTAFTSIEAAVNALGRTIDVAAGTYSENVVLTRSLSLVGAGAQTILQAPSTLGTGVTVNTTTGTTTIADLTISGFQTGVSVTAGSSGALAGDTITGSAAGSGIVNYGTLSLTASSVTDNLLGTGGDGGGILNGGTLTLTASTVSGNFANLGGGIYNFGTLTVSDSTIANNSASADGGGIENSSGHMLTLENSTVSGNSVKFDTGGGVDNRGPAYVANTIIAGNSLTGTRASDPDVSGTFTATDHDLIGVVGDAMGFTMSGPTASIAVASDDAATIGLAPLADNGGSTQTMALVIGSPAIGTGDATPPSPFSVPSIDQRGQPRITNGALDIGAFQTPPRPLQVYVAGSFFDQTTGQTTATPNLGDTVNWLASGQFSEVDGLTFGTNAFSSVQLGIDGVASTGTVDVAAGSYAGSVVITQPLTLVGAQTPTADLVTIAGSALGNGISVNADGPVSIQGCDVNGFVMGLVVGTGSNVTLTDDTISDNSHAGGYAGGIDNAGTLAISGSTIIGNTASDGAGIYNSGTLTVNATTISANTAVPDDAAGGGIDNQGALTVTASTITDNVAYTTGGGINNLPGGTLTVSDSTIAGNSGGEGGGIGNEGTVTLISSTISGNAAKFGGGIQSPVGTINAANTIIAGNSAIGLNPDVHGIFPSTDHDLIGVVGDATGFTTSGSTASIILGSDDASAIGLAALADNGGPTQTMALLAGSPAIDAGDNTPPAPFTVPDTDQRGVTRITVLDPTIDIGAYEAPRLTVGTNASLTSSTNPSILNQPVTFTATVTATSGTALPTGTVAFELGSTVLDIETLNGTSGAVSFSTNSLPVGTSEIQAVYTPTGLFATSNSNVVSQQVNAYGAASQLVFIPQPTNTTAGNVIGGTSGVSVLIEDAYGNLVANDNSAVTIAPYGPGVFTSGNTATINADNGVATFNDLVLDTAGNYTLAVRDASDGASVNSAAFTVSPAPAAQLVFTALSNVATIGTPINAPAGVKVAIEDRFRNVETNDQATVLMTIAAPSGDTFAAGSTTSQSATNGVATFTNLIINATGTYNIEASDAADGLSVESGAVNVGAPVPVNVTANGEVTTSRTGYRFNFATHQIQQTLTFSNQTASSIAGPFQIGLTNLSANVSLASASLNGTALTITQDLAGEPTIQIPMSLLSALAAKGNSGSSASILLGFNAPLTLQSLSYTPEVLAGPYVIRNQSPPTVSLISLPGVPTTPTVTGDQNYVESVYRDVLGRLPDASGLTYWTNSLESGGLPGSVAEAIAHSDEFYANFVIKPDFQKLLGRLPQPSELNSFLAQIHAGLTDQGVESEIVATDEFFKDVGGTNLDWIDAVYQRVLGRKADAGGEEYWSKQLALGQSRLQVAQRITQSQENNAQLINDDYFHFLGRTSDTAGLEYWQREFTVGMTNEDVIASFTGSQEYFTQHSA